MPFRRHRRVSREKRARWRVILIALVAAASTGCSYLSYQITEETVELPGPEFETRQGLTVERIDVIGSVLRMKIVDVTRIDQNVQTRTEKTVDYEPHGGMVYEGIGQPVVDIIFAVVYFIPDSIVFLGSSMVMGPAGAIAAIDSTGETTVEKSRSATPVANITLEVSIDALRVWERVVTDDAGLVSVDLADVESFGDGGPVLLRVRERGEGAVTTAELSEAQLADLRLTLAPEAVVAAVPEPTPALEPLPAPNPRTPSVTLSVTATIDTRRRVALVIGNSSYEALPALENPKRDASDLAAMLESVGFEVLLRKDQNLTEMKAGLREFSKRLDPDSIGLFYYAGHAIQAEGSNYLIPIGADIEAADEVEYEAIDLARVLGKMEATGSLLKLVFVDACRNDPYSRFRSASRGLAVTPAPRGTLIAYATAPGDVAADGDGRNSPFARNLISAIGTPGLELKEVISRVQQGVYAETDSKQRPWLSSDIFLPFYFQQPSTN